MKTLKTKLISRKFLTALAGLITGLAMIFGIDEAVISTVAGAVISVGAVVAYIITEGRVDAARAAKAAENVVKAVEAVDAVETAETAADGQQSGGIAAGWTDSDISPDNQ
ncbi:MAG: hypothetical protein HFF73_08500 [Oscillospiraceae bacterium]|nr:hypothetical protein [Oscillospiraceae bacterium]